LESLTSDEVLVVLSVTVRYSVSHPQLVHVGGGPHSFHFSGRWGKATGTWFPSNTKTKSEWSSISIPSLCLHVVSGDNFTFAYPAVC
jgi:hypothetical protein